MKILERLTSGPHFAAFTEACCRHTQGGFAGQPYVQEEHEREFFDEALEFDENGRRVWHVVGLVEPRKNGKTTRCAGLALYLASPAEGEARPKVVLAAGSKEQAGEGWDQITAFIEDPKYGSPQLAGLFRAMKSSIVCPANGGVIQRVAGDGKLNHSLNPSVVVADELHAWITPRQKENWKALTTAQGGRQDPLVVFISSEGEGDGNVLAEVLDRVRADPNTEVEERRPGLTIYRNRDAKVLVYVYAVPKGSSIADVAAFKLANPASWRTEDRLRRDLLDPMVDEPTKRRLYGNERVQRRDTWIKEEVWAGALSFEPAPPDVVMTLGADAARTRDTTAVGWAWRTADGRVCVDARVWSVREDKPHHVFVPGGRLDNNLARDFIRDELLPAFACRLLFYDERYFDTQANDLSNDGMTVVEMHQGKPEMIAAWDEFYADLHEGPEPKTLHAANEVLDAHVAAAVGIKTERGWKVSKSPRGETAPPIDGLAAVVMARFGLVHFGDYVKQRRNTLQW